MKRMSRAGRKDAMYGILRRHFLSGKTTGVTVGFIARKMGLKSSTYLKNLLKEMCEDYPQIQRLSAGDHSVYRFREMRQTDFFDRVITINKERVQVSEYV